MGFTSRYVSGYGTWVLFEVEGELPSFFVSLTGFDGQAAKLIQEKLAFQCIVRACTNWDDTHDEPAACRRIVSPSYSHSPGHVV
jgi:hypothetical protein